MSESKRIKTALVSVYHKEGLDEIITKLHEEGVEFLSTGGTRQFIESLGYPCKAVEDLTTYPSILGGIIVQIGDKVYDASALRKLKKMEVVMNGIDVHDYALEKPEAMTDALSEKLENYNVDVNLEEVGIVEKIGDGIATVIGMKNAMAGELVELPNNVSGMVLNLNPDSVGIVLMGGETLIKEGDLVRRTGNIMDVPVGEALLGRVVSAIGAPIDGKGEIAYAEKRPVGGNY